MSDCLSCRHSVMERVQFVIPSGFMLFCRHPNRDHEFDLCRIQRHEMCRTSGCGPDGALFDAK